MLKWVRQNARLLARFFRKRAPNFNFAPGNSGFLRSIGDGPYETKCRTRNAEGGTANGNGGLMPRRQAAKTATAERQATGNGEQATGGLQRQTAKSQTSTCARSTCSRRACPARVLKGRQSTIGIRRQATATTTARFLGSLRSLGMTPNGITGTAKGKAAAGRCTP